MLFRSSESRAASPSRSALPAHPDVVRSPSCHHHVREFGVCPQRACGHGPSVPPRDVGVRARSPAKFQVPTFTVQASKSKLGRRQARHGADGRMVHDSCARRTGNVAGLFTSTSMNAGGAVCPVSRNCPTAKSWALASPCSAPSDCGQTAVFQSSAPPRRAIERNLWGRELDVDSRLEMFI